MTKSNYGVKINETNQMLLGVKGLESYKDRIKMIGSSQRNVFTADIIENIINKIKEADNTKEVLSEMGLVLSAIIRFLTRMKRR